MDRLSALDASFLYGETPESPMHVAGLAIFDPPPADSDVFAAFRDHLKARLHLVPFFERKLALTPIQLDHPVWFTTTILILTIISATFRCRSQEHAGNSRPWLRDCT
ncbi:wax ester/triacylglycerol synthase family O-acyltransferase [Bradyrhizobium sp. Ash2021]|nr:wax ester/triacylglycerol synthase domain-containing protein [Bradyrhizobium sp. Ash2021]WMT77378.1 wax ester/triacylglycerol synthase family O-acyltransferase [Bradyrhizobium sp. Ash2021]